MAKKKPSQRTAQRARGVAKKRVRRRAAAAGLKAASKRQKVARHKAKPATAKKRAHTVKNVRGSHKRSTPRPAKSAPQHEHSPPESVPRTRLSAAELASYRELLLRKRLELLGDVETLQDEALSKNRQDASGNLSNMPMHMADVGSDHYEQEFTLGLIESERAMLREIDEALQRIVNGTYGICAATGRPIGKARLNATPWTKYCYEYVLEQERGRGRRT